MSNEFDFPTEIVQEGEVKVLVPKLEAFVKSPSEYGPSKAPVFYNPVMELNRDIAVLALQAYQRMVNREISVCEPLTGCGIRGLRFAAEVEGVKKIVINDVNMKAFQLACHNIRMNELSELVFARNEDAHSLLGSYGRPRRRFDAVDIDPFGTPVPYLNSAIRALRSSGFLILTATDMAPLCGVHPKACIRKYGGNPLRTEYCQELAVRLLAGSLAMTAAKLCMGISLVFSHSIDHYIRIYSIVKYGAKKADENIENMGYILHCFKCFHREVVKKLFPFEHSGRCSECGSKMSVAGPLWLGRVVDKRFCESVEDEAKRRMFKLGRKIRKNLMLIKNEAEAPITYYVLDKLCSRMAIPVPSVKRVVKALRREGFHGSLTHFNSRGIRSNVPAMKMKELLLEISVCKR